MGEGYGHGVGRVRLWCSVEIQESHHHVVDLLFLCPTVSDDGGFDLGRAVRADVEIFASQYREDHPPALGEGESRLRVDAGERRFDRRAIRGEVFDNGLQTALEIGEALRSPGAARTHDPCRFDMVSVALGDHQRPAGGP